MRLRLNQAEDQSDLKKMIRAIYQDFESSDQPAFFNWPDDKVQTLFGLYQFLVLESIGSHAIYGFICFQELSGDFEIILLGVDLARQGQGHMGQLFDYFVENICKENSKIILEVHEKNQRAISFYKKVGFEVDGIRKGYYSDGGAAVNMSLTRGPLKDS